MGLGSLLALPPDTARRRADEARAVIVAGGDPLEKRKSDTAAAELAANRSRTFAECATEYIQSHEAGWKNAKHVTQWRNTLRTYADPVIGKLSVADVSTEHIARILQKDAF